ncbi:TATA-binding protein-associated factor mot1 [Xylographa carneopallida]|nr:TATA-binding protein-associated factor mot1 [Xylographa carneopallida]
MTSRLDRLVTLLETGSTKLIRDTAAQQLSELQKQHPDELFNLLSRVIPYLRSSRWETRLAAAKAIGGIVENAARFDPNEDEEDVKDELTHDGQNGSTSVRSPSDDDQLQLATLDIKAILRYGKKLLGSAGKEYDYALATLDPSQRLALQKRSLQARLGLGGEYFEEDILNDKDLLFTPQYASFSSPGLPRVDTSKSMLSRNNSIQSPYPLTAESPHGTFAHTPTEESGLSKRQLNQLKRKTKMNARNQSNKVRVIDLAVHRINSDLPQTPMTAESDPVKSEIKREGSVDDGSKIFSLDRANGDDDSKVVSEFKGPIVPEKPVIQTEAEEDGREWPFEMLCDILSVDLFDPNWEIRHGAAMGLREVIRVHGGGAGRHRGRTRAVNNTLNAAWLDDLACRLCCVLMLDRFGDYISDNVVAPIRETTGQTLGALLLHLPTSTIDLLYKVLHRMVLQTDLSLAGRVWEVCHGGMLGFKYLGVVRKDVLMTHLDGIVEAVMRGLADFDDDVRAVSAATLIPISEDLVEMRPGLLPSLINLVWDCLSDLRDDLSASTGNVMDLLAKLCSYKSVLTAMLMNASEDGNDIDSEHSFFRLVPRLYPFLRHTISSVRSAVLRALQTFLNISAPQSKSWVGSRILRLVFQNLLLERNEAVLELSFTVWQKLASLLAGEGQFKSEFLSISSPMFSLALHPIGVSRYPIPIDYSLIMRPSGQPLVEPSSAPRKGSPPAAGEPPPKRRRRSEKKEEISAKAHNVDGHMLQGDVDLVGAETLIRSRIYGSKALGEAMELCSKSQYVSNLTEKLYAALSSPYSTTQMTASMILEEQAKHTDASSHLPAELIELLRSMLDNSRPEIYTDLVSYLQIARAQCQSLLNAFRDQGRISSSKIPTIAVVVQGDTGAGPTAFSLANAEAIVGQDYDRLKKALPTAQRFASMQVFEDAKNNAVAAIEEAKKVKLERDIRIRAAASGALVAMKEIPKKPASLIKSLTDSVRYEENSELQKRSAMSVSSLMQYYASGERSKAADKIINNIIKFYCIDTSETPEFPPNSDFKDSILSLRKEEDRKDHADAAKYELEAKAARITRRGAKEVIDQLALTFANNLFTSAPSFRNKIVEPLQKVFSNSGSLTLDDITDDIGQDVVDAFSLLRVLVPNLHSDLQPFVDEMIPTLLAALRCRYSVFRYAAAKCFATICSVWTVKGMTTLVEKVLPAISNPLELHCRQGVIECVYHLIHVMEDNILPYVIFLIVPILGRMSDSDGDIRLIATTTFATLVKLVPLEAGIADPPGFSEELLKGRDKERKFVAQMLDPKKTDPFEIPVDIKATLRSYQQDGVNWLAFLNRFNLHGILCDDMGLGKTLQTLCIVASDHHLRAAEYENTKAPEVRRLPSLIVCPPTLSGHWQQEIKTYAPFLSCLAYVGPPADRNKLVSQLGKQDIVITSYDVCRNDIDVLLPLSWNYCVLDEGHLIKNPKAKITIAVKRLSSNHRLILSGTPIQNNVLELWSLFDFLMPGFLGAEKVFQDRFARPIAASRNAKSSSKEQERGALAIEALHKQVLPFLLRRLKEEVLDDLPPKILQNYYCDLSELQKTLFEDFAKRERKSLEANAGIEDKEAKQHIFQALQYMRKLCNSPSLIVKPNHKQYEAIQKKLHSQGSDLKDIAHAPKLTALRDLLVDCGIGGDALSEGDLGTETNYVSPHRALIFCQMKEMLDIVQNDVLKKLLPTVQYLRLDGGVEANKRQNIVNQFNTDPSYDVLLLTTSVGGLGLNLTGADTVIFVEHDWNPQKDLQAMDRAHRIGQKKVVNVYRLITRGTLEEKILNLQRFKIDVASTVVNQQNAGLGTMETDQILDLFNLGETADGIDPSSNNINGKEEDMVDATGEVREKGKKGWLDDLGELWDENQYEEEYNLDSFLANMKA